MLPNDGTLDGFDSPQEVSPHGPGKAYLFYASSCGVGIRVAFTDSFRACEGDCCVFFMILLCLFDSSRKLL